MNELSMNRAEQLGWGHLGEKIQGGSGQPRGHSSLHEPSAITFTPTWQKVECFRGVRLAHGPRPPQRSSYRVVLSYFLFSSTDITVSYVFQLFV